MQNLDTVNAASATEVHANDLGPLAWVLDELRKSLDSATKALRRYVRDAELARGSDLAAVDSGQLRISRQQLHQAVGALDMVGFAGPATLLRSMENAVQRFVTRPELCTEDAAIKIERASFALTGYLETVLAGKNQSPVALFAQYAAVQEVAAATRVHPADLWNYAWRWTDIADTEVSALPLNAETRSLFDRSALAVIKLFDQPAASELARLCAAIAQPEGAKSERQFAIFWRIAAGFFEAIGTGSLTGDVYVKRTVSRILTQLATHVKGDMTASDRLAQDLLFFCAQATPQGMAPLLGEVRMAYGLAGYPPVDYSKSMYGQFDPVLLVQARKRISSAKESWSNLAAGDMGKIKMVQDQFSLIVDSIGKLLPTGQSLSKALMSVAETSAKTGQAPEPALGMEVATSILYLEAGFEDFDPGDSALTDRINHLAQRVENARQGATNQPLEPWMEELYRRVSDRQTMGSVVGELKTSLAELEKSMDQFFRDPQDKTVLANVPSRLSQMRGVLSVLGLDQASHAVMRMRDSVEQILVTEVDDVRARAAGTFDKLGNNLGALGFLIDMLSYQPVLAKKLFVFDEEQGELKPLMGRVNTPVPLTEEHAPVEKVSGFAALAPVPTAAAAVAAMMASAPAARATAAIPAVGLAAAPAVADDTFGDDAELRDIFLEEAREVIGNGQAALLALETDPSNLADMTTLRRAFHTLKGSSRMVGLNAFGEAGWAQEQLLNAWLADQKPADNDLRTTTSQALAGMAQWVEAVALNQAQGWSAAPFRESADSLRTDGKFLALVQQTPSDTAPVAMVAPIAVASTVAAVAASLPAAASEDPFADFDFDLSDVPAVSAASTDPVAPAVSAFEFESLVDMPAEQAPVTDAQVAGQSVADVPVVDDLDFAFDLAIAELDAQEAADPALPAGQVPAEIEALKASLSEFTLPSAAAPLAVEPTVADMQVAALPEVLPLDFDASSTLTVDDGLSTVQLAAAEDDLVFDLDISPDAPAVSSAYAALDAGTDAPADTASEELVSADEFAAFEAAMLAQDALLAEQDAPAPSAAPVYDATEMVDFTAQLTQPMMLVRDAASQDVQPADLGFDLGNFTSGAAPLAAVTALAGAGSVAAAAPAARTSNVYVEALPAQTGASGMVPLPSDDQYKAIGPLRISLPLYNVYLNEADEWSRRLVTCLTEWSLEPQQPMPGDAMVFAHSLAGSSGTVGFNALSGLARTMEHALQHVETISEDGAYPAHVHASDFVTVAEEIRRLLHQFAAGLLREPAPGVEELLQRCLRAPEQSTEYHAPISSPASGFVSLDLDNDEPASATSTVSTYGALDGGSSVTVIATAAATAMTAATVQGSVGTSASTVELDALLSEPAPYDDSPVAIDFAPEVQTTPVAELDIAPTAPIAVAALVAAPAFAVLGVVASGVALGAGLSVVPRGLTKEETEDEIDVVDAIDPDLFPIFEEEALELFPQLSGALRQWNQHPGNTSARSEVLRGLHTMKGSARLAGAMRLGELTHRMESEIESTSQDDVTAAQIEPLNVLLDGMQANFDRLRNPQSAEQEGFVVRSAEVAVAPLAGSSFAAPEGTANAMAVGQSALLQPSLSAMPPLRAGSNLSTPIQRTSTSNQTVRVRSQLLDRLVNQAGEVMITRSRLEAELGQLRGSLGELTGNLDKLRTQLRDIEVQSESQMQSRMALSKETSIEFDPLEFDRFTRVQELTRMMAESVNDVATVQRSIQRTVEATEDDLVAQARQTRELQRDLLRTRMVEFEGISERLYRVVRQAGKDAGKQVKLEITGGSIEMDRGVLDRMTPAFEHLLRNCVAHGIESAEARTAAGKDASGQIVISLHQEGNDVSVEFRDDGAGLNLARIRERAQSQGLLTSDKAIDDNEAANLIFTPGFTTATQVTELSGRGIGMDVVRSEVYALGGRIETSTSAGQGTSFKLVMPLTTAVTQVVMLRIGNLSIGVPANLVEAVRRATPKELQAAYNTGAFDVAGVALPFFWSGALLQHSRASDAVQGKTIPVLIFRSAAQRIVAHVDEVLGNQEVVVKNLGPQLSRLPGLAGMSVLASGAVALIYNPVALATIYGAQARTMSADKAEAHVLEEGVTDVVARDLGEGAAPVVPLVPANPISVSQPAVPLVLVVDDSITVRRVTQRLLQREGYRVALAADGLLALERLAEEMPSVVLSDIEMPRMDGFDLVRNMKADPRWAKLPIITITSRIAEKHREHAMSLGVDHYLGKPYSEEELLSLIRRYTTAETAAV